MGASGVRCPTPRRGQDIPIMSPPGCRPRMPVGPLGARGIIPHSFAQCLPLAGRKKRLFADGIAMISDPGHSASASLEAEEGKRRGLRQTLAQASCILPEDQKLPGLTTPVRNGTRP